MGTANIGPRAKISRSDICHVNDNFQYNYIGAERIDMNLDNKDMEF